ncbi:JmjC domain-containing protein [Kutzneria sp. NPDC052558]|uniref:JmjC domain-containing protein n=1 Tax=Kutzneria sp. NPDC052558 TaxID=3364121 RepID=UPI0037C82D5C
MTALGMEGWFAPVGVPEFGPATVGRRPLYVPPRPELADNAMAALGVASADDALALTNCVMFAWFQRLDGRHTAAQVPAGSARRLFDAGMTIYLSQIQGFAGHERELAELFGVSADAAKVELFCNRPSAVTRAHFDPIDLVTVQLRGRKTWRIAPNTFAPDPYEPWATLERVPPTVRQYADGEPPARIPDDAVEFTLDPGAVLHVPRGYWHETVSDRDSMSLHLLLTPPTRLDAALAAVKNELVRDPFWRASAYDPRLSDGDLATLRDAVSRLDFHDLDPTVRDEHPVEPGDRFARAGQVSFGIEEVGADTTRVAVTFHGGKENRTTTVDMNGDYLPACGWIDRLPSGTVFDLADLLRQAPDLAKDEARQLIRLLLDARLVRREPTR